MDQLSIFADLQAPLSKWKKLRPQVDPILLRPVDDLELTVRFCQLPEGRKHLLHRRPDSAHRDRAAQDPEPGRKSLNEIKEVLPSKGLTLGMKLENWLPAGWTSSRKRCVTKG